MKLQRVERLPKDRFLVPLRKADEATRTMRECLATRRFNSAGTEAIQAVISSCDALTIFHLGLRSTGQSHLDVLQLLGGIPLEGSGPLRRQAESVLELKSHVQYEVRAVEEAVARKMVLQAERVYDWTVKHTGP